VAIQAVREGLNPKSEGRRPKETRSPKAECEAATARERPGGSSPVRVSVFGLLSGLGFRASDFKRPFGLYAAAYGRAVPAARRSSVFAHPRAVFH
jgi:hypothetical protein